MSCRLWSLNEDWGRGSARSAAAWRAANAGCCPVHRPKVAWNSTKALHALHDQKKSLLAAGITALSGDFQRGDAVRLVNPQGHPIGVGLVRYASDELQQISGRHSDDIPQLLGYSVGGVVVHRDELIVFA